MVQPGPLADDRIALNGEDSSHFSTTEHYCSWHRVVMAMQKGLVKP